MLLPKVEILFLWGAENFGWVGGDPGWLGWPGAGVWDAKVKIILFPGKIFFGKCRFWLDSEKWIIVSEKKLPCKESGV
jgi:hypothetical protein